MIRPSNPIIKNIQAFASSEGLRGRVLRGGVWLGGGSFVEQVIRLGRNILLTRVLAPQAFGEMAIVLSATTLIQLAVEVGVREALIQNSKGNEDDHVNAAWWMAIARSVFIYSLVYLCAPIIARFYGSPELSVLARLVTLSVVFDGALSPRAYVAIKEMKFKKWALVSNGGGIFGVAVTVILSFFLRDVWALAIGFCSENAARFVLSYIVCPFAPRWPNAHALRDLLRFSKGLFGLSLFNLIFSRADIFVLGKLYSAADLGLYAMAIYLVQTPTVFLINVMNQTLLPAFSKVQNDNARLNRILLKVSSAALLLGLPVTVFVALCGRSLLTVAYGQRYAAAGSAMAFACCNSLLNVLNNQITMAFYAKGQPQLHRRSVATMAVVVVVLIYPLARVFGLWGAQLAALIAIVIGYLLQVERIRKVTGLRISEYLHAFPAPVVASMIVILFLLAVHYSRFMSQPAPDIAVGLVGCVLACGFAGLFRILQMRQDV